MQCRACLLAYLIYAGGAVSDSRIFDGREKNPCIRSQAGLRISNTPTTRRRYAMNPIRKTAIALIAGAILATPFAAGAHESTTMVGGQAMYPSKDIVDNAVNSADHRTLVAAVKAAGLVDT